MDWFERLTGFQEDDYHATRARLSVDNETLTSRVNGKRYGIGRLEVPSLAELRDQAYASRVARGKSRFSCTVGDARELHAGWTFAGALFQVASQFNLLEMINPGITPEHGVGIYQNDPTQGPACAIAAGAATIYRNYFVDVGGQSGQTGERQLDMLAELGAALAIRLAVPVSDLWQMTNGYALCTPSGLSSINALLRQCSPVQLEGLRGLLRIGLHRDIEVTDAQAPRPTVSQAFCSALPVAYTRIPAKDWAPFAQLVLEAAYEATLLAAVLNARRGRSNMVMLTAVGGGAFGNLEPWIERAILRALHRVRDFDLDVRLVAYGRVSLLADRLLRAYANDLH